MKEALMERDFFLFFHSCDTLEDQILPICCSLQKINQVDTTR